MLPTHFLQTMPHDQIENKKHSYPPNNTNSSSDSNGFQHRESSSLFRLTDLTVTTEPGEAKARSKQPRQTTATTRNLDKNQAAASKPSRWKSPEFVLYEIVVFLAVSLMTWVPISISDEQNPQYHRFASHLKQGWLFGRRRDDSDFQYRSFRDYVGLLTIIMFLYLSLSKLASSLPSLFESIDTRSRAYRPLPLSQSSDQSSSQFNGASTTSASASTSSSTRNPNPSPNPNRKTFLLCFITVFILALHGSNALKILFILTVNYYLTKFVGGKGIVAPTLAWTFNCAVLGSVHWNDGFSWGTFLPILGFLDDYQGLLPRWQINFNISMLRLVSFGLDYHWAIQGPSSSHSGPPSTSTSTAATATTSTPTTPPSNIQDITTPGHAQPNPRQRVSLSRPLDQYSFVNCLIYVLYPPLFIAGPIMTFNDFTSQLYKPLPFSKDSVIRYAIRVASSMLVMEFILHFIWVNAIKDSKAWNGLSPLQLSMVGFWNLIIVWLKLLIPWRFFRLWSLADGVDPPENMVRCMANNYSTLGFWRSWHRSYNLWIVRYIYIPLGGSKNPVPSTLLVFTFVALWHDLSFKLLYWGWLVTFFVLPEMIARKLVPEKKYGSHAWYRHLSAIGGVANVLMMMTANLVGFAIGVDGVKYMWQQILGSWQGVQFMVGTCFVLFTGVQVMFEYREEELRNGISRKC